ncbi:hypothetical protein [Serratia sp. 14-2641]|uniref:hypothetical protein n=1 Tax=Serratia sp. 14-2641 TaxID=1841657 RepID=UPI00080FA34E|nr:hypothetical protein [Serratia sp. 14-2641]OCJ44113.1 hypothetical protein A6U95_19345 [Serratia sp. 14-2641]
MTRSTEMTLEQAVQHAKNQAEVLADTPCGLQHAQLAGWLSELLAVRDAQGVPIGCIKTICGNKTLKWWRDAPEGAEVFTAPPAPAVPAPCTREQIPYSEIPLVVAYAAGHNDCRNTVIQLSGNSEHVNQAYTLNSPVIPDGWKLVPAEPTPKQWAAGIKAMDGGIDKVTLVYRAMVAEAPKV